MRYALCSKKSKGRLKEKKKMKWEELALLTSSVAESSTDGRGLCLRLLSASGVLAILLAPASDASVSSSQLT